MVLNDLLKLPELKQDLETFINISQTHKQDVADKIKSEIMTKYRLNESRFTGLYERIIQQYIPTQKYRK